MNERKSGGPQGGSGNGPGRPRGGRPGTVTGDMVSCWLCSHPVSQRALFCHHCGTVQPPRVLDPFTRLGLPVRFDVDLAVLERQFTGFRRTLAPERFADKGPRERSNARAHLDALQHAYDTLRDPVRRARYLLDAARPPAAGTAAPIDPELAALEAEAADALDAAALDRLANRAARDIEQCILDLSAAFRAGELGSAAGVLARLVRLEALAATIRERRQRLPAGSA
jgi:molecular chaperone HscB